MSAEEATSSEPTPTTTSPLPTDPTSTSTPSDSSSSSDPSSTSLPPSDSSPHPLHTPWTLYFSKPSDRSSGGGWQSNVHRVASFSTAEDFWRLFNVVKQPSALALKVDLMLFRGGIGPEWEDRQNKDGGKWQLMLSRGVGGVGRVDDAWMATLLLIIGEGLTDAEEVCGVVLAPRAKDWRLSMWTRTAKDEAAQKRVGQDWKAVLGEAGQNRLEYQSHADAMNAGTNYTNYRTQASYVL